MGGSLLLAVCVFASLPCVSMLGLARFRFADSLVRSPAFSVMLISICLLYLILWSRVIERHAGWPRDVSIRWTVLSMTPIPLLLLSLPLSFVGTIFSYLFLICGTITATIGAWPFLRRRHSPKGETLGNIESKVLDYCVIPLLIMMITMPSPLLYHYLLRPETESLFFYPGYRFMGEIGQFLAWGNAVYHGAWQGRDFFCLYGPLHIFPVVALWKIVGRSGHALIVYWGTMGVLSSVALYAFFRQFWKRHDLCFLIVLNVIFISAHEWARSSCRFTASLGAIALIAAHGRGVRKTLLPCGILVGISLATSQEVGLATLAAVSTFVICKGLDRDLAGILREMSTLLLGILLVLLPLAVVFSRHGALLPLIQDMMEYPRVVTVGFGNLPFPDITSIIPLNVTGATLREFLPRAGVLSTSLFYYGPVIYTGSLMYLIIRSALNRLRFDLYDSMIAAQLAYGMMMFGVALGRSGYPHLVFALQPAFILHLLFVGRAANLVRNGSIKHDTRGFSMGELIICGAFICASLLFFNPLPAGKKVLARIRFLEQAGWTIMRAPTQLPPQQKPLAFLGVAEYIRSKTSPEDAILSLPNNAAYYYLADRPNATRFCQFHMLVSNRYREEALEELREHPPEYVIYDIRGVRVDNLSDEVQFPRVLEFILQNYVAEKRMEDTLILHRSDEGRTSLGEETVLLFEEFSQVENVEILRRKAVQIGDAEPEGVRMLLEGAVSQLTIENLTLDASNIYLFECRAKIDRGNVGRIMWRVKAPGGTRQYSKMFAVDMRGESKRYWVLLATPDPQRGEIESITMVPSDKKSAITLHSIRLTRLDSLSPPR